MNPVYVSPSVQEHNLGIDNYGTEERVMNLIADVVCALLTYNKVPWVRNKPSMNLAEIIADSNNHNAILHIAIHSNAGRARGCEVYTSGSKKGRAFAQSIYNELSPVTPVTDRGVKATKELGEVVKTHAPAALAEVSFHDNPEDAIWILSHIHEIGEAIAKGICNTLGIPFRKPQPVSSQTKAPSGKYFKVQVGAFSIRNNAEKLSKELLNKGYKNFIVIE